MTRPMGKGGDTAEFIRQFGWDPLIIHSVDLRPRDRGEIFSDFRSILSEGRLDWLVFMSPLGVQLVFEILKSHGSLLPSLLGQLRIVAVGPRTKEALLQQGVRDVLTPNDYSSEGVAALLSTLSPEGKRVVLVRSSDADDSLAMVLATKGVKVVTMRAYSSFIPDDRSSVKKFADELELGNIGGVLFTSSQSTSNLFKMVEDETPTSDLVGLLGSCLVGAIGPVTARRLRDLGVQPDIVPTRYVINDAAKLLVETWEARQVLETTSPPS